LWFLAIVVVALLLAVFRLTTRYSYGPKTRRLLTVEAVLSLLFGLGLARWAVFPDAEGGALVLAAAALGLGVFVFAALGTVELLRKAKQRVYDDVLVRLKEREQSLELEVEKLERRVRAEASRREVAQGVTRARDRRAEGYRRAVEDWVRAGGAARIRTIKVEEWKAELRSMDPPALAARQRELEEQLGRAPDPERRAQLEAMLALTNLVLEQTQAPPGTAGGQATPAAPDADASVEDRLRELREELERVRADSACWRRHLSDFLSREIDLD